MSTPDMTEVHPKLYVGWSYAYENAVRHLDDWYVVHACKEPYHRNAVGYEGGDPPPDHFERLFARRGNRLMLNLVDAAASIDIPRAVFDAALDFIHEGLTAGRHVLVHCEMGISRSPSIALLYLARYTGRIAVGTFQEAEPLFAAIYPDYNPGPAIRLFMTRHWKDYARPSTP